MLSTTTWAQLTFLTRVSPEEEGIRSRDMLAFMDSMMSQRETDMHGVMVLRNGHVIGEKYNEPFEHKYNHTLYSCSKTFTAIAVGMAIEDSLLHLDDHLIDFFPDIIPEQVSDSLAAITIHDLLTMQSGMGVDTQMRTFETEWIRFYLNKPMVAMPGTRYAYDSIVTYLLSAIVQTVEGQKVFDLLKKRLFTPMGITQVYWEESPEGVTCGGWGLYMQLESMAKFGQLLLQRGEWDGQQLVSAEWIDLMCQVHATQPGGGQYGYQIWITPYPNVVRCDGAYGQYIFVMPDQQMVVAMTQCNRGSNKNEQEWIWQLGQSASPTPLPEAPIDYRQLLNARYRLTPTRGNAASINHREKVHIRLGNNDLKWKELVMDFGNLNKTHELKVKVTTNSGKTFTIRCGHQTWITSPIKDYPLNFRPFQNNFTNLPEPFYVGASYAWTTPNDLFLRLHYVNWLSSCRLQFQFTGTGVSIGLLMSYTTKTVRIVGEIVK